MGEMAESIFAYINDHTWAQWAFALFVIAPPMLITLARRKSGLASLDTIIGWFAVLLILALIII